MTIRATRAGRRLPAAPARLLPVTIGAMALVLATRVADLAATALPALGSLAQARAAEAPPVPAPIPVSAKPARRTIAQDAPTAPEISDAERGVLLELRQRREAIDAREAAVTAREAVLAAATQRLTDRIAELTALQRRLETLEAARQGREEANWRGLVKLYEGMKPRDAATIFDELSLDVLLPILDRMKEGKAAPVLAAMSPERARLVTAELAALRLRETGGGPEPAPVPAAPPAPSPAADAGAATPLGPARVQRQPPSQSTTPVSGLVPTAPSPILPAGPAPSSAKGPSAASPPVPPASAAQARPGSSGPKPG